MTLPIRSRAPVRSSARRLVALAVLACTGGLPVLQARADPPPVLPAPTGRHAVGRVAQDWVDGGRVEAPVAEPGVNRTLRTVVWYPALSGARSDAPAEQLPDSWKPAGRPRGDPWLQRVGHLTVVRVHALPGAPMAASPPTHPVLIMQPAVGRLVIEYTTLAEELASHGYVVVGVMSTSLPGRTLGELMAASAADFIFVLNRLERMEGRGPLRRLAGRLDLRSAGVFGHSSGGAAALVACLLDPRFKAGVDVDGYPPSPVAQAGVRQPFMFIWSEPRPDPGPLRQRAMRDAEAIQRRLQADGYQITIKGARHFNFSDHAALASPAAPSRFSLGPIDGRRGLAITADYLRAFFDRYLRGADPPLLTGAVSPYPEVAVSR
jgi:dienelactone hydrolase